MVHITPASVKPDWNRTYSRLLEARLPPASGVKQRLEGIDDIDALIAQAALMGISGQLTTQKLDALTAAMSGNGPLVVSGRQFGRTIAPLTPRELAPPARLHGLPEYDLSLFDTAASDVDTALEITFDITGNSTTEGRKEDIQAFFNYRFQRLRSMIIRKGLPNRQISISELLSQRRAYQGYGRSATIIGMVNDPKHTKNGHFVFVLEDEGGEVDCICYRDEDNPNPIIKTGLMQDDVIAVTGNLGDDRDVLRIDEFHRPPLNQHHRNSAEQGVSVAFISDIHVGSKTFLEAQWMKMVDWFASDPLARTIKYLILSGDVVDGVGIYPNQDRELAISDLFGQYSRFAELLELLPDWVECLLLPGNHDAVRPAEPQPALDPEIQQDFNSTTFVGNPCSFELHGVSLLSYHGKSIDDFVGLPTVDYGNPVEAMREMLRRRHLAPTWGSKTPLSPEPEDNMIISEIPDIFVTGHVHGHACLDFKGTTLVCSSTWQDQTAYQRMLGFQPKPCILTVINLKTHATASIPFA